MPHGEGKGPRRRKRDAPEPSELAASDAVELVRGPNLRHLLSMGKLSLERIVGIFRHICEGVDAAHRQAIIHRDLKPENVLIGSGDLAKISDFGLARLPGWGVKTTPDQQIGSAMYSAPEHLRRASPTVFMDVYSIGVMLYEAVRGEHFIPRGSLIDVCNRQLHETPPPLATFGVRSDLSDLVAWAMAKEPTGRCSARQLAAGLEFIQRELLQWRRQAARNVRVDVQTDLAISLPAELPKLPKPVELLVSSRGTIQMPVSSAAPIPSPAYAPHAAADRAAQLPPPSSAAPITEPATAPGVPSSLAQTYAPATMRSAEAPPTLRSASDPLLVRRSSTSPLEHDQRPRPSAEKPRSKAPLVVAVMLGVVAASVSVGWMLFGGGAPRVAARPPPPPAPSTVATASPTSTAAATAKPAQTAAPTRAPARRGVGAQ